MSHASVEQLLEQIQRHLDARQGAHQGPAAVHGHGDRFSETVYDTLEEAGVVLDSIRVHSALTPPHLPLIGGVWQKVRGRAHDLVVFYVNRLAGVQSVFNREILAVLSAVVSDLDRGGRADLGSEFAALRAEVAALRAQVERLQKPTTDPGHSSK